MKNWYAILQVSPQAHIDTIRIVARTLKAKYHPDNKQTGNQEKFVDVSNACDILSDPQKRAAFDRELWERKQPKAKPCPYHDGYGTSEMCICNRGKAATSTRKRTSPRPTPSELFNDPNIPDVVGNVMREAVDQFYVAAQDTISDVFDSIRERLFQQGERARRRRSGM